MSVHYFVNYFVRLRTNHYTCLTISPILFIFDSVRNLIRNLPYRPLWHYVKIPIIWQEWQNTRWEKLLARWFMKCHISWLYTYCFSHFDMLVHYFVKLRTDHYTLLTISPILFIFDSVTNLTRNLPYRPFQPVYTYRFSCFAMFVHYFVNYLVRLWTNHYTLLTISPISFIFDSARKSVRNLTNARTVAWKTSKAPS